jgi:hypothetical protein
MNRRVLILDFVFCLESKLFELADEGACMRRDLLWALPMRWTSKGRLHPCSISLLLCLRVPEVKEMASSLKD